MQESFWWWYCNRHIISSPHLHTPFPPFSLSLISLMVSVDVKHHVYLLIITMIRMGVVSPCWTEIPDQNIIINLIHLVATIKSFKMLIDYPFCIWQPPPPPQLPPHIPPPHPTPRKKRWQKFSCFKSLTSTSITVFSVAHVIFANTPSKFFHLHLWTNFLSFDLDLLAFRFSNLFLFSCLSPSWRTCIKAKVRTMLCHEWRELASVWLNCTDKPITCYDT